MKRETMKQAGKQVCSAIVLGADRTKKGDRVRLQVQIIGGGVENLYPTLNHFEALKSQVGKEIDVEVVYTSWGTAESTREKDGRTYTDQFTTYRQRVFLPYIED